MDFSCKVVSKEMKYVLGICSNVHIHTRVCVCVCVCVRTRACIYLSSHANNKAHRDQL